MALHTILQPRIHQAAKRCSVPLIERQLKPSFRAKGMGWDHPLITPQPLLAYFLLTVHCATHSHF